MVEGWKKGETERTRWVSVRVWGDSKKSRPMRGKATRLGGDQMRKGYRSKVWVLS